MELSTFTGCSIVNLDPTKSDENFDLDENNDMLIFGRDCYMIKNADVVIVHLTDDISVGGSQEMLIAKYYKKPLIGIAPKGGKFNKAIKVIQGKEYKNWIHPFVSVPCDGVVEDVKSAGKFIKHHFINKDSKVVPDITLIEDSVAYYMKHFHKYDKFLHDKN
ncbi:MAG: hypothetical protein ACPGO5_05185 [Patescibacteria group bacterium]